MPRHFNFLFLIKLVSLSLLQTYINHHNKVQATEQIQKLITLNNSSDIVNPLESLERTGPDAVRFIEETAENVKNIQKLIISMHSRAMETKYELIKSKHIMHLHKLRLNQQGKKIIQQSKQIQYLGKKLNIQRTDFTFLDYLNHNQFDGEIKCNCMREIRSSKDSLGKSQLLLTDKLLTKVNKKGKEMQSRYNELRVQFKILLKKFAEKEKKELSKNKITPHTTVSPPVEKTYVEFNEFKGRQAYSYDYDDTEEAEE